MTIKTDIDQLVADAAHVHAWANGSTTHTETMGAQSVRSPAKLIADKDAEINVSANGILAQAATQATNAANSATAAAASYDSFDDRYLGSKSSAPTVDNDGNALLTGALYWNSSANQLYVWTGSAWNTAFISGTVAIANGGTGATDAATARANLGAQTTLVSGTNIKTVNGGSLLGSGDLAITVTPAAVSDQSNSSTGYFDLPAGTDAQRPGTPGQGMVRYNTTSSSFEGHNGTAWVGLGSTTFSSAAENIAGTIENKSVDPLGLREAFNATGNAPVYACRAWVNFNGTGTVAIRASGNVSSITDNGVGDYTVNFATAMPDANYGYAAGAHDFTTLGHEFGSGSDKTASSIRIFSRIPSSASMYDRSENSIAIFR